MPHYMYNYINYDNIRNNLSSIALIRYLMLKKMKCDIKQLNAKILFYL